MNALDPHTFDVPILAAVTATITGSDTASAAGVTVTGSSTPILALCRQLLENGYDPTLSLIAVRDDIVCLFVPSIGTAATLEIRGDGVGFRRTSKKLGSNGSHLRGADRARPGAAP
jgi:hypothetical protein